MGQAGIAHPIARIILAVRPRRDDANGGHGDGGAGLHYL